MSSWLIEIENATPEWVELPAGSVKSCSSGTGSESQVIPDVSITFAADIDIPAGILDPELNRNRARLRITDGSYTRYFRIERQPGSVRSGYDYPQITGRAAAGIITEFRSLTYDFLQDISASDMARLVCTQNALDRSGESVGVIWLAAIDPVIPGGRFQVSKRARLDMLREIVEMCGAKLRVSTDGRNFEVYDRMSRALIESVTRTFAEAQSLSYQLQRVKQPGNAVRVQGEQADYTRPTLPMVQVAVAPTSIDADDVSTATATATVLDSSGNRVQHKAIVDEAITAGSYTAIPVSGCFDVQAVWLNTGTQQAPVKGTRVTPSSFTAAAITVPDNGTQLFIVSYTQAEQVGWSLSDQADEILGEQQNTTGSLTVSTDNAIGRLIGVYLATDANRAGTNYADGGSYSQNTTDVTLGISPGNAGTAVIIDYETYNGAPLSATISPSTSLCDDNGQATATIGAGSTVGTAKVTASALGQEGNAWLSLLGSAIAGMELTSDKAEILVGSKIEGQAAVSETNLTVYSDIYGAGTIGFDGYVVVSNSVAGSVQIGSALDIQYAGYKKVGSEHRLYLRVTGDNQYLTFGTSVVDVSYNTTADIDNASGTATITATVTQADDSPVSDGTQVDFSLIGPSGAELSSLRVYTADGVATTELSAGAYTGVARVSALCGSQRARFSIAIVRVITDDEQVGTVSYPAGTDGSGDDDDSVDGSDSHPPDSSNGTSICGSRRLVGCDNEPLADKWVTLNLTPSITRQTNYDGWFGFCVPEAGSYNGTITLDGEDYTFSWTVADV